MFIHRAAATGQAWTPVKISYRCIRSHICNFLNKMQQYIASSHCLPRVAFAKCRLYVNVLRISFALNKVACQILNIMLSSLIKKNGPMLLKTKKKQQQNLNKQSFLSAKIIKCVKGKTCVFFLPDVKFPAIF